MTTSIARSRAGSAALLLDPSFKLKQWQLESISQVVHDFKYLYVVSTSCQEKQKRILKSKYIAYYLLNILSIRKKKVILPYTLINNLEIRFLEVTHIGSNWFGFTKGSIDIISADSPEYIFKCALGLIKIDPLLTTPILSFHHGDPSLYRGRPAGFYELMTGRQTVGQIVQVLSNKLDSGKILAFGESKVFSWSYKKTLDRAYSISPFLLKIAVNNLRNTVFLDISTDGTNYRLPSNLLVLKFLLNRLIALCSRYIHAIFFYKRWNIAAIDLSSLPIRFPMQKDHCIVTEFKNIICSKPFGSLSLDNIDSSYQFYADPFIQGKDIIFEGLNIYTGLGEILALSLCDYNHSGPRKLIFPKSKHLAYPYTFSCSEQSYIYPDTGSFHKPFFLKMSQSKDEYTVHAMNAFDSGITDPSVFEHSNRYYLFGNLAGESNILRLWHSTSPDFLNVQEHQSSPICLSPFGGRMGGRVFSENGNIYRLGQDNTGEYGKSLLVYHVVHLTESLYCEKLIDQIAFSFPLNGPHTFDFSDKYACWDYYQECFSPFAWLVRLKSLFFSAASNLIKET